jgi:hypothetical protein
MSNCKNGWDHNHATGLFRGTLCFICNMAIGMFKDDEVLLNKAIDYLRLDRIGKFS